MTEVMYYIGKSPPPGPPEPPTRQGRLHYQVRCRRCDWACIRKYPPSKPQEGVEMRECARCDATTEHEYQRLAEIPPPHTNLNETVVPLALPQLTSASALNLGGEHWINALVHRDVFKHEVRQKRARLLDGREIDAWDWYDPDHTNDDGEPMPRWKPVRHYATDTGNAWRVARQVMLDYRLRLDVSEHPDYTTGDDTIITRVEYSPVEGYDDDEQRPEPIVALGDHQALALVRCALATLYDMRERGCN